MTEEEIRTEEARRKKLSTTAYALAIKLYTNANDLMEFNICDVRELQMKAEAISILVATANNLVSATAHLDNNCWL